MDGLDGVLLVMWLDQRYAQQSRESIASYFNPIKLADATPDKKGVRDPQRANPRRKAQRRK